jgi:hypothetical protein
VILAKPAPAGGVKVGLSVSNAKLSVPISVTVPPGSAANTFTVAAARVPNAQTATLTASLNGISKNTVLNITVSDAADGLIGWWKLDETSGTGVEDASGNGNGGRLTGNATRTSGIAIGALQFDRTGYVRISPSSTLNFQGSAISFGAWYYHTPTADGCLLGRAGQKSIYSICVDATYRHFIVSLRTGAQVRYLGAGTNGVPGVSNNRWVHIFVTYDGSVIHTYVNGALVASAAAQGALPNNSDSSAIGAPAGNGSGDKFNGRIDDVRIYNRALSAAEVLALYSTPGTE